MEKTNKMTQKMALNYVLDNFTVPTDVQEKLISMIAAIDRKNASGSGKQTATQKANAELKDLILAEMENGKQYTITDMLKSFECLVDKDYTNQKISALMSAMVKEGLVERITDKRRSYFSKVEA